MFLSNRAEPVRQTSLLMVLASGVGDGTSLIEGLDAYARESRTPWSDRIRTLLTKLEMGLSLSAALHADPGLLPDSTVSAIHVGEETGTLRDVLLDEANRCSNLSRQQSGIHFDPLAALLFLVTVGTVLLLQVSFVTIYLIPKLKRIFEEFEVELPPLTQFVLSIPDTLGSLLFWMAIPVMSVAIGGLWFMFAGTLRWISRGQPMFVESWSRYWVPDLLKSLSISAAAGHDFGRTVHSFQSEMPAGRASRTISEVRSRLDSGEDFLDALSRVGLLSGRECAFLGAARRNGHLDWGMRQLGLSIQRRRLRLLKLAGRLAEPLLILGVGFCVGVWGVGLFLPLIKLMNDLS